MNKIKPNKVLFIKLGPKGIFEESCIEEDNTLRLGYGDVNHEYCKNKDWGKVHRYFIEQENTIISVATNHTNQIKAFYEEGEDTLWITYYQNRLWWCFSKNEIAYLDDKTKTRPVIGKWRDYDINGNKLLLGNLSGKLLKTQGFRGTICRVPEYRYAVAKINCEQSKEVKELENVLSNLIEKLIEVIQNLQWEDFESLIDLIFRQAGWLRVSELGKTQKTIDLELLAPVTGERAVVQIKASTTMKEFEKYEKEFERWSDYDKIFYVAHTNDRALEDYQYDGETNLYLTKKIAELTISSGLIEWVIQRVS